MKEQDSLTAQNPAGFWVTGFTPDTLLVHNYTPWPVYLRLGDTLATGPKSYHVLVPPATATTLPVSSRAFSASLGVVGTPGVQNVGNERVDLIWTAGEVSPASAQYALLAQPSGNYAFHLDNNNISVRYVLDLSGYPAWGFTVLPTAFNQDVYLLVELSADAVTWYTIDRPIAYRGTQSLIRYYPAPARFARVTLSVVAGVGAICDGLLAFVLTQTKPDKASYTRYLLRTFRWSATPTELPYFAVLSNFAYLTGELEYVHIRLIDVPMTASRLEPFVWMEAYGAYQERVYLQNGSFLQQHTSAALQAERLEKRYNAAMTLQSLSYLWRVNLPAEGSLHVELHVEPADGVPGPVPVAGSCRIMHDLILRERA